MEFLPNTLDGRSRWCVFFNPVNVIFLKLFKIAKMLQNLANKPSYSKEAYMITLNPFVENNKARINQFLNNLCEVGDFYDTLEVSEHFGVLYH